MITITQLKNYAFTVAVTLLLTACNNSFTSVKENTPQQTTTNAEITTKHETTWQQAYGNAQEPDENELEPLSDSEITLLPPKNLWQRIRNGYGIKNNGTIHPDTQVQLERYASQPEYINLVVERAKPYLHYIVDELEKRQMPLELALLPIVESAYKPYAYSSGRAAGLWQFIPDTGKLYGLKQDWWYDGRRDIIESTRAALDYLEKLHNDFGTWPLALAAYNSGEGTVGRAIKHNIKAGKPTDFWSLSLPKETSVYVPRLLAIAELIKRPKKYNLTLNSIDNSPFLTLVDTGSQIDLTLAAKMAEMTTEEMYLLNPGFSQWATSPDGPHRLVLPLDKADIFQNALNELPAEERVQWTRHKVNTGESLSVIARHYKTTVAVIKEANGLSSKSILRANSYLLIPSALDSIPTNYPLSRIQGITTQQAAVSQKTKKIHTVVAGDTWWEIAKANNVEVQQLTKWNSKSQKSTLHLGQKLVIWKEGKTANKTKKSINYITKNGDSLWKISQQFKVSVNELREWNGLSERTLIQPGQNLTLHLKD